MPLSQRPSRGTLVYLPGDPSPFSVCPNGTTVYLHRQPGPHTRRQCTSLNYRTMQTTRLLQIASLVPHPPLRPLVPTQEAPRQEKNSEQEKSEGENSQGENSEEENSEEEKVQTKGTGRVESRFFYVVRDMDLGPEDRRIKVGVSGNLEATLRTYRRRIRNDHLLVTADCGTERGARRVERHMKGVFSAKRDHEIYLVGVHEVIRELSRLKFRQGPDGIFRE